MQIDTSKPGDAPAIARIARSLLIEGRDLGWAEKHGFFIFAGTPEHYAKLISESRYCYTARDEQNTVGFLITREPHQLAALPPSPRRDVFLEDGQYPLLIEQIGILPDWQDKGIGQAMLDRLLAETGIARITATLVVEPIRNDRSIRFFQDKNGWTLRRQVKAAQRVWSFYELRR